MTQWRPYQSAGLLDRVRYVFLPGPLAKRHYHFSFFNRVGVTIVELLALIAFTTGIVIVGIAQRGQESEASGQVAQLLWIPLVATIMYRSVVTLLFGISVERSMMWHGYFALVATAYGVWHGYIAIFLDNEDGRGRGFAAAFQGGEDTEEYWTGAIATGFMLLTVVTSGHLVRRLIPRIWLWSHHIFPLAAAVAGTLHGAGVVGAASAFVVLDRVFGYVLQAHVFYGRTKSEGMARIEDDLVRLSFPRKQLSFSPGQYMGICIPSVSWFEWHTFTIASAPCDDEVVFLLKPSGMWTRRLYKKVERSAQEPGGSVQLPMWIHGPLGSVALDWTNNHKYSSFLMIGGGLGITPIVSFYRHMGDELRRGRPLNSVRLVYTTRNVENALSVLNLEQDGAFDEEDTLDIEAEGNAKVDGFRAFIHLTKGDELPATRDVGTGILSQTVSWRLGRPDMDAIFHEMSVEAKEAGIKRVGVLTCGPDAITKAVIRAARRASSMSVSFDVHVEHFQ